jgi:hypothetical protein
MTPRKSWWFVVLVAAWAAVLTPGNEPAGFAQAGIFDIPLTPPALASLSGAVPNAPKKAPKIAPVAEEGLFLLTVETIRRQTPKVRSILAKTVELWWKDALVGRLNDGDPGVENQFHQRIFRFPPLAFPPGYHFVTIRVFAEGFVTREMKQKSRTVQIGIHSGRATRLEKLFPFFVW